MIAEIKKAMLSHGAKGAVMTGSGPTVFGIFDDEVRANAARESIFNSKKGRQVYVVKPLRSSYDR